MSRLSRPGPADPGWQRTDREAEVMGQMVHLHTDHGERLAGFNGVGLLLAEGLLWAA